MYDFDPQRLAKLDALREAGVEPYPNGIAISHQISELHELGEGVDEEGLEAIDLEFSIAGRLRFRNLMGKAGFARIQDVSGRIQIYIRRDDIGVEVFREVWKKLDLGDWIQVTGRLMRTRTGELSIRASTLRLARKCMNSLPDKHHGFTDAEMRQRMRYVDLFMNEEVREVFQLRSRIIRRMRDYFDERGYLEVETPMMHVIPGGANARPFITHHNALGIDMYLRVAPELFLKRLVVGGFERVYEVNRNFRNEGVDLTHNPEFTMLEFYQAYATYEDLMDLTEELISGIAEELLGRTAVTWGEHSIELGGRWRRASMEELIREAAGVEDPWDLEAMRARWLQDHPNAEDMPTTAGKWFEWFFDAYVEDELIQPTFVTHYPAEISPLSRRSDADPRVTDRFELVIGGYEMANGFSELNDPVDQAARFAAQAQAKNAGDEEAMFFDADYIRALTYGMPPTAGEGLGVDRIVMLLCDRQSIRDVILFPALRPEAGAAPNPED